MSERRFGRKAVNPVLGAELPLPRYLLVAAPGAGFFLLLAVAKLALNPVGNVRRWVREEPLDAYGSRTLTAFAIPALLAVVALASGPGLIVTIALGQLHTNAVVLLLIQAVAAFIAAVASGFLLHPALERVVTFLGGRSDNVSRTNYFVNLLTALPLVALAVGVAPLTAVIPVPFIGVLPPILAGAAVLVLLWVSYAWFKSFAVGPGLPIGLLILMAASIAGASFPVGAALRVAMTKLEAGAPATAEVVAPPVTMAEVDVEATPSALAPAPAPGTRSVTPAKTAETVVAPAAAPVPASLPTSTVAGAPTARSSLAEYERRRARIEAAIAREPGLIHEEAVRQIYVDVVEQTVQTRRRAGSRGLALKIAIQSATADQVDRLYGILFSD